jgi:serine/threonine protein kinase
MADLEGRTLDRYELERLLGRGGMADVYVAYDPHFERQVAIKVFKREDEDLLRRFVREAQFMASLSNTHLIPVFDAGVKRLDGINVYYIVMPLMEGGTLRTRIKRGPLPLKQVCTYAREIASALDYIHSQGIIHRDIKASNVLLDEDGRCYLSDFGIARAAGESTQLTTTGNVMGTVDYIAPELFESDRRADEKSDLYSFGILLYEMVTGRLPFIGENPIAVVTMHINNPPPSPRKFAPDLSPQVEQVLLRALEKRPERRYESASTLAEAFCRAVNSRQTRKMSTVEPLPARDHVGIPAPATPIVSSALGQQGGPRHTPPLPTGYQESLPGNYAQQAPIHPYYGPQSGQPQYVQSKSQTSRSSGFIAALVVIALLAVIGASVFVVVSNNQRLNTTTLEPTATPNLQATTSAANATATAVQQANATTATAIANTQHATATAQANAHATATVQARQQATATVQAQATQTVLAHATATAAVIQTATTGTPAYSDPLTDANNTDTQAAQWDTGVGCAFHADGYYVSTNILSDSKTCYEKGKKYQNFAAQVDVTIQKGHSGGLFFRSTAGLLAGASGYLFEIDSQGNYKISSSSNFSLATATVLHDWTASSALKTGNTKNRLQVIARDNTLLFYANGTFLISIQDNAYSSGTLGFLGTANQGDTATVIYANLAVYPQ